MVVSLLNLIKKSLVARFRMLRTANQDIGVNPKTIEIGSSVIVYESIDSMSCAVISEEGSVSTRWGNFPMKEWIGKPYGRKIKSKDSDGWIHLLAPTPELWTLVLPHRTQILYLADISMVCTQLELRPGCIVLESGTGSGSLTTSLARAVAPTGHVYTFEFHEKRAEVATDDFHQNGLLDVVTVTHRDVELEGFPEHFHNKVDAIFLDLPGPWKAIPSAVQCLKQNGTICSFSPCIEQVQQACEALHKHGCKDVRTVEVLLRDHDVAINRLKTSLDTDDANGASDGRGKAKRAKTDSTNNLTAAGDSSASLVSLPAATDNEDGVQTAPRAKLGVLVRPSLNSPGHTGYLTFCRTPIAFKRPKPEAASENV